MQSRIWRTMKFVNACWAAQVLETGLHDIDIVSTQGMGAAKCESRL